MTTDIGTIRQNQLDTNRRTLSNVSNRNARSFHPSRRDTQPMSSRPAGPSNVAERLKRPNRIFVRLRLHRLAEFLGFFEVFEQTCVHPLVFIGVSL